MNSDQPPHKATSASGPPSWMAPVTPVVPDHELIRRIGGGSYGDVWLARNVVGTWRAVKVVFRDRFTDGRPYEREFNGIQKFEPLSRSNEGFIDILQIGRNDAEGYFYYVMELADPVTPVFQPASPADAPTGKAALPTADYPASQLPALPDPGRPAPTGKSALQPDSYVPKTLAKVLLQRGRLPVNECLELGITLNLALGHLHRAGLIHRDIKPSNIIFVGGVPKLADIGLVVETSEARSYVGTEGFIPPEGPTSPQADLYSLGKVLYEAGMGKDRKDFPEPFTQIAEVPDREQVLEFNAILLKACAASVKDRYQTAEEMNAELALLRGGGSVRQQRALSRRLRFVQRAGALVTAFAAVIALGWWWQASQTRKVRDLAAEKSELADANAHLAQESHQRLIQMNTANGLRAMEENNPAAAVLSFAEALKLSEGDKEEQTRQRYRLGTLFQQLAKPMVQFHLERPACEVRLTSDRDRIVAVGCSTAEVGYTAEVKVWELASQRLVQSLTFSNLTDRPKVSPNARWVIISQKNHSGVLKLSSRSPITGPWNLHLSAFSPDDRRIADTKIEGTEVYVREMPSGNLLFPPLEHSNAVTLVRFDPTGRWLVTAMEDKTSGQTGSVRIWDAATGRPMSKSVDVSGKSLEVSFSPDGKMMAIYPKWPRSLLGGTTTTVVLDLPSGRRRFPPVLVRGSVDSAVFSPDGRWLAIGPKANPVCVINTQTGEILHDELTLDDVLSLKLGCSPDGAWLAAGGDVGIRIWDLRCGLEIGSPIRLGGRVMGLEFLPGGNQLLCADASGLVTIYNLADAGMALPTFTAPDQRIVTCGAFSPDGTRLAAAAWEGAVNVWPLRSQYPVPKKLQATSLTSATQLKIETKVTWSPDGNLLAVACEDNTVRVWDVASGQERCPPLKHSKWVEDLEFSPDSLHLATASQDGSACVWELTSGRLIAGPLQHSNAVVRICFSKDGQRVLTSTVDGQTRFWEATTGQALAPPVKCFNEISDLALSPDGSLVAVAGDRGEVVMLDAATGQIVRTMAHHNGFIYRVSFSPDGRWLLTASEDKTARVWDVASGKPVSPPLPHPDEVWKAAFSPDGQRVITGSVDGTVRIWDAASGERLSGPLRHKDAILSIGFSPDGNQVFISSASGSAQLLNVPSLGWNIDEIVAASQLLSGASLDSAGKIASLTRAQVEDAWSRVAQRFAVGSSNLTRSAVSWHYTHMLLSERVHDWFSAEFHARRLVQLLPDQSAPRSELAKLLELKPQPRDPSASKKLIDLTAYYNGTLQVNWLQGDPQNNLAEMPRGIQTFAGTQFDVRGLIQLLNQPPGGGPFRFPSRVDGIRVDQKFHQLHVLHSNTGLSYKTGAPIGHYIVHYANGRTEDIPIRYNVDVADWWARSDGGPLNAVIAWQGMNPCARQYAVRHVRLYEFTWTNPAPELEVSTVDFVADKEHYSGPFLIALTVE